MLVRGVRADSIGVCESMRKRSLHGMGWRSGEAVRSRRSARIGWSWTAESGVRLS